MVKISNLRAHQEDEGLVTQFNWQHKIMDGFNFLTIHFHTLDKVQDPKKRLDGHGKIRWYTSMETTNHYTTYHYKNGFRQPKTSKIIFGKKVRDEILSIIDNYHNGIEPVFMNLIIKRMDFGSQKVYFIKETTDNHTMYKTIEAIKSNNFEYLNKIFENNYTNKNNKWIN